MMKDSPCNGCTEREIACSDHCPKDKRGEYGHAAWVAEVRAEEAKKKEMRRQWKEDVRRDRRYEFVTTKRRY
jgi:surface antigen